MQKPEWRATTGKTQPGYCNEYPLEISFKLQELDVLDKTLFVLVSDHGDRI
jgi:hypothetical protein